MCFLHIQGWPSPRLSPGLAVCKAGCLQHWLSARLAASRTGCLQAAASGLFPGCY
uniref:Uncharacterized protein n=1 Tax=Anguilla anguilla TaxID=7936 RepID=A0A0E9PNG0_ANGAN